MKLTKAIVFDLDDTLYAEVSYVESGRRFVASWLAGKFALPAEDVLAEFADIESRGFSGHLFDQWLVRHGLALSWLPQVIQAFREHLPTISPFPSAPHVLQELRPAFQLGLVTDGYLVAQQNKLAALGLAPYFNAVVFSDVFGRERWKPHALPYKDCLRQLHVEANAAVYVGDNPQKDFIGARAVGMGSIRLRHPLGIHAQLPATSPAHNADLEIEDLSQLPAAVAKIL